MSDGANTTGRPSPESLREAWARVAVQTAAVAGALVLLGTVLLAWDYSQRLAKDPLNSDEFKSLKAELAAQPQSEDLKTEVRDLDRVLRSQYFAQRRFTSAGTWILLGGMAVALIALRAAAALRRTLPQPEPHAAPVDREVRTMREARWASAATGAVLAIGGLALALNIGTVVPDADAQPQPSEAAVGTPGSTDIAKAATPTEPQPEANKANSSPQPGSPPSGDEFAKAWPQFRGPTGIGVSTHTSVPTTWDGPSGKNVLWKIPVPMEGNSSPVVWKNRIFLTGATNAARKVFCFDTADGKLLWQKDMPATPSSAAKPPEIMGDTGFASSTPATDGQRVYAMYAIGDLAAFDFDGKQVWVRSLGIPKNAYGHATSLGLFRNLLLVQFDQASAKEGKSKLMALDGATGKTVWETPRPVPNSWCTPIVVEWKGQEQIIAGGDPWVIAYHPADGKEIWRVKCLGHDVAASPVFADGVVYVANDNAKATAIRIDGRGDVSASHTLWIAEDGLPDTASPLATPQYVLLLTSSGMLTGYDAKSGKKLWEKEFESGFKASPTLVDKNVYLIGDEGKAWVVEPTPAECKNVAEANLGEPCAATPAFQDGRIYLRGKQNLYCVGAK